MPSGSAADPSREAGEYALGALLEEAEHTYRAVDFDGIVVEKLHAAAVAELAEIRLRSSSGYPLALLSVNLDHFHRFRPGPGALNRLPAESGVEWLSLADGAPVAMRAGRIVGQEWPRVTGADLLPSLLRVASDRGIRVGFLGGAPEMHEALSAVLATEYRGISNAFFSAPPRSQVDSHDGCSELAAEVRSAGVELLCVGLGKPRQELWIDNFGAASGAKLLLPFGAAADFLAGRSRRAPRWMQASGLEWAFRLGREPTRLARRYLVEGPPAAARLLRGRDVTAETLSAHSSAAPFSDRADSVQARVARGVRARRHSNSKHHTSSDQ